eukprot:5595064-Prorocentrum_lima.AAC.1
MRRSSVSSFAHLPRRQPQLQPLCSTLAPWSGTPWSRSASLCWLLPPSTPRASMCRRWTSLLTCP